MSTERPASPGLGHDRQHFRARLVVAHLPAWVARAVLPLALLGLFILGAAPARAQVLADNTQLTIRGTGGTAVFQGGTNPQRDAKGKVISGILAVDRQCRLPGAGGTATFAAGTRVVFDPRGRVTSGTLAAPRQCKVAGVGTRNFPAGSSLTFNDKGEVGPPTAGSVLEGGSSPAAGERDREAGNLAGDWFVNANNHVGRLRFSGGGSAWRGEIDFGKPEKLGSVTYEPGSGRVAFVRPISGGEQPHTGVLRGREIQGTFLSYGRGPYLWCATLDASCTPRQSGSSPGPGSADSGSAQGPGDGPEQVVFQHATNAALETGVPPSRSRFSLDRPRTITRLRTYHWNAGRGTHRPGTIGLQGSDGRTYGPWPAAGTPGQGGIPNAYWDVQPGVRLPAGSYTVVDSDPSTWGHNSETGGQGIIWVYAR